LKESLLDLCTMLTKRHLLPEDASESFVKTLIKSHLRNESAELVVNLTLSFTQLALSHIQSPQPILDKPLKDDRQAQEMSRSIKTVVKVFKEASARVGRIDRDL